MNSYLIEITRDILAYKDEDGASVVDLILDTAGQGHGKWTAIAALDTGMPLTLISEAVFARCLSAIKEERVAASRVLRGVTVPFAVTRNSWLRTCVEPCMLRRLFRMLRATLMMSSRRSMAGILTMAGLP